MNIKKFKKSISFKILFSFLFYIPSKLQTNKNVKFNIN